MHAQTTFISTHAMPYSHAAVSRSRRRVELRFWLFVYALLVFLIVVALGTAALLFWWTGYIPGSAVVNASASGSTQPAEDLVPAGLENSQPSISLPDKGIAQIPDTLGESASVQLTSVESVPTESAPLIVEAAPAQPTQAEPVLESVAVVEPTPMPEPLVEPTHRQIYLSMDDDYHSQLSVPNGQSACGPAALLIALDYYDLQSSLPDLIAQASFTPQEGGYDPTCTANAVCTSPQALARLASEEYGLDVQYGEDWTFEQVYSALESGSPVIADIAWDPGRTSLGHFVVIYGIDPDSRVIYYHDPYDGAGLSTSWDDFHSRWSYTVDVGDPLQDGGYTRWGMAIYMR